MRFPRVLAVVLVLAAASPGTASSADVRLASQREPVGGDRSVSGARAAPFAFNMVGLHWQGPGEVWFRTAAKPGAWSAWRHARPEADDLPDASSPETAASGAWKLGNPWWTGTARSIQYRYVGRVERLRAHFIWSEPEPVAATRATTANKQPAIVSRAGWGADESIVRSAPAYAERLRFAVVHHTAGTNSYSSSQSAAIVRGIQRYHVLANGWNDIGYNFLVDKYGKIFEGRGGGIDRNVVGAHAGGFNTGSTGVSVLGSYQSTAITSAAQRALVRLLAWRLERGHVDPTSLVDAVSGGNERFRAGTKIRLRAVSGHRDTGYTSCPGTTLYGRLGTVAANARARGLPKLWSPAAAGGLGGPVRITAKLSTALPWTVVITEAGGGVIASGSGSGTAVDWTWNASAFPFGDYRYTISAGPEVHPATYRVPGPPPLAVTRLRAKPAAFTPNGDGRGDTTTISFSLNLSATATVTIRDSGGAAVRTLASSQSFPPGTSTLTWNGNAGGAPAPDGRYTVRVQAQSPGQQAEASRALVLDRTLGHLAVEPALFSPNGDGRLDTAAVDFELVRRADVRARVFAGTRKLAGVVVRTLPAGEHSFAWDGRNKHGVVPSGAYTLRVEATTGLGTRVLKAPLAVDTIRPVAKIVAATRGADRTVVKVRLSEAAQLRVWYGTPRWSSQGTFVLIDRPAGLRRLRVDEPAAQVRVVPFDLAGNKGRPATARTGP